ncbi:putative bifunctional diguanylate cyclase/phosphodiesterase [Stenotrophomonas maltophilia]|uniref:putative bifunctional diguanylate cyclase/phosphodiesterase n=1 Tax=Stenotrophomonas maltophilia TaxID=40324 RepID=UPI0014323C3F|nr:EAL domain-containing protein [Stenotrophomonas maltophilia]
MAIARDELVLLYQSKLDLHTQQVIGAEALVRWMHPDHGLIGPASFIPLAERSGLIHPLGTWVLNQACLQLERWREAGAPEWSVAVNVSPVQLQRKDFYATTCHALSRHGVSAGQLVLEVTETGLMEDLQTCQVQLFNLMALGVQISLDDFGTGSSSLARLKNLPVHEIKMAREFIDDLATSATDYAIVAAMVELAHRLDLQVVAEGVENELQTDRLRALGCDVVQGFLYGPAVRGDLFLRKYGSHEEERRG